MGDVTGRDGVVRELEVYVAEHNGQLYIIPACQPHRELQRLDNLVYHPMLASFQFA